MKNTDVLSKKGLFLFSVAIVLTRFAQMGDFVLYPITNEIYKLFPDAAGLANYIVSGPPLLIVAVALLLPLLSGRVGKRTLLVVGAALFAVGGILGAAWAAPEWMAFTRTLVGIGQGILGVVSVTIVTDVIQDKEKQARYVGIYNASSNLGAMILSLLSGGLAAFGWKAPFLLYLFAVPMVVALRCFVPESAASISDDHERTKRTGDGRTRLGNEFWALTIAMGVFSILRTVVLYYMSAYVEENALGGSGLTALATSLSQAFAFAGAMSFTILYKRVGRWIMAVSCGMAAVALVLWCGAASAVTVFVVYCLICGGSGLFMAYSYAHSMLIVPRDGVDQAIGALSAVGGIASFVTTYLVTWLMKINRTDHVTIILPIPAFMACVLFTLTVFYTVYLKKNLTWHNQAD